MARLRQATGPLLPLPALSPDAYSRGHALFEARSDQRKVLTGWLRRLLGSWADTSPRVLSIGCGDGTVDAAVADLLARPGRVLHYDGIEPHPASGRRFLDRLGQVSGVRAALSPTTFAGYDPAGRRYDLVLAVHSLYYVPDLADAIRAARRLLAPGGMLVVLHAPLSSLNRLVGVLAQDQGQEFSEAVRAALSAQGEAVHRERLDAALDLTASGDADEDRRVLDFAVQVALPDRLRPAVLEVLRASALPGPGLLVPHPIDAYVVRRAARETPGRWPDRSSGADLR